VEKRKRGRPRAVKLATLDEAVEEIKKELLIKYGDEKLVQKFSYAKGTLQNKISAGQLIQHGNYRCSLVDLNEVIEKLVG